MAFNSKEHNVKTYLQDFLNFQKDHPGPIPYSVSIKSQNPDLGHLVVASMVHGDEVGSLPAVLECIKALIHGEIKFVGQVTFIVGNHAAGLENKRFLETDLNRSFSIETEKKSKTVQMLESKRAEEIKIVLNEADMLLDFHQTKKPTKESFYVFGFHTPSYFLARALGGAHVFVTRKNKQSFSSLGLCIDEYTRLSGAPSVTLELSQRGFTEEAHRLATLTLKRFFEVGKKVFQKTSTLKQCAHKNSELSFFVLKHKEPFSHPKKYLHEGFENFSFVKKGEVLGVHENNKQILAAETGYLLFPKYPERDSNGASIEPLPGDLFHIIGPSVNFVKKVCSHLS